MPHIHEANKPCLICIQKREMAQMFRNIVVRMRLATLHRDRFVFEREAADLWDRSDFMPQWMDLCLHEQGFDFEDVDFKGAL